MLLEGKRVVVTGASRGIGRAVALACAREGAVVGINYRSSEAEARAVEELISTTGGRARLLPFDVSDPDAVSAGLRRFLEKEERIDGLVNNAAINRSGLLVTLPVEKIREQLEINLLGPIVCAQAVLPAMIEQRGGVVINVGSVASARPSKGQAVYAATKGALESFTRALAVEYGRKGIRAHCLQPGPVETSMLESTKALAGEEVLARIPLRRFGQPEEVAEMAVFLLSERAAFITGSTHSIDGGFLLG